MKEIRCWLWIFGAHKISGEYISNKISGEYLNMFIDLSSCASFFEKEKYIDRAQIMLWLG